MDFKNPYWSDRERIELLQRWIIIHSILYYELDNSIVSDKQFDVNSRQLMVLKKDCRPAYKQSKYYNIFKDFDGCTGFDLYGRLGSTLQHKFMEEAQWLIKLVSEKEC